MDFNTESDNVMLTLRSMPDESGDQRTFEIPFVAAKISDLIKDAAGDEEQDSELPMEIEITRVKGDCLEKVVDFMKHYHEEKMKEIPTPLGGSTFNEVCKVRFVRLSRLFRFRVFGGLFFCCHL